MVVAETVSAHDLERSRAISSDHDAAIQSSVKEWAGGVIQASKRSAVAVTHRAASLVCSHLGVPPQVNALHDTRSGWEPGCQRRDGNVTVGHFRVGSSSWNCDHPAADRQGRTWHGAGLYLELSQTRRPLLFFQLACVFLSAKLGHSLGHTTCVTQYKRLSPQPLAMPSQTASCGFDRDLPCF